MKPQESTTRKTQRLESAVLFGDLETVNFLTDIGTRVDSRTLEGNTLFDIATAYGREEVLTVLLEKSKDLPGRFEMLDSALDIALENNHLEIIKILNDALDIDSL